jgi:bile acid:Na+ symporter, BASS family
MTRSFFSDVLVPVALVVIMLGIGLSLTMDHFRRLLDRPRALLVGIVAQFILLPLLGLACALLFQLPPAHAVGVMLVTVCAGGAIGIVIVRLAEGDTALAVALTAVSIPWSAVSIPAGLAFATWFFVGGSDSVNLPLGSIIARVAAVTLLPVGMGMILRAVKPALAQAADGPLRLLSSLFLAALLLGIVVTQHRELVSLVALVGPAMFTLSAAVVLAALGLARAARLDAHETLTIGLQSGIRNTATAIFVAVTLLNRPDLSIPAVVYTIAAFVMAALVIAVSRYRRRSDSIARQPRTSS